MREKWHVYRQEDDPHWWMLQSPSGAKAAFTTFSAAMLALYNNTTADPLMPSEWRALL